MPDKLLQRCYSLNVLKADQSWTAPPDDDLLAKDGAMAGLSLLQLAQICEAVLKPRCE